MKYRYLKGYKYELLRTETVKTKIEGVEVNTDCDFIPDKPVYIVLFPTGELFVKERYAWDGASFLTFDTKSTMKGSLIHDALYQLMREGKLDRSWRKYADELLRDICIEDGMWKFRANLWCWFCQKFGEKSSKPSKKPRGKIIEI